MADSRETPTLDTPPATNRWAVAGVIVALALFSALVEASQNYIGQINFGRPVPWTESIRRTFPSWVVIALLAPGALYLGRKFPIERGRLPVSLATHLIGASAFAFTHLAGTAVYYSLRDGVFDRLPGLLNKFITAYFILDVLIYCGIVGASHALKYYREAKARELAQSRLQESLTQARLATLRGQLNPHFLFNTLNAIATMALKGEHDNVVITLGYLSELLRVSLDDRLPQEVALADELELLERYLEIQRIRFGDRLKVTRDIDDEALGALVPIMILQPLAENAIVHGVAPIPGPGEVTLRAARRNGELVLEVSDTGPGFATVPKDTDNGGRAPNVPSDGYASLGIGLANTRARLSQLYGDRSVLSTGVGDTGGARVSVRLPFRLAPPAALRPHAGAAIG